MNDSRDPLALQAAAPGPQPAPTPGPEVAEDSGSQALSEALRSSFMIVKLLMIGVVLYFLFSGVFTVGQQQKAVILRFGKPVGVGENALLGPGLHFAFPAPIDEIVRIPIGEVQTVVSTIGWYAMPGGQEPKGDPKPSLDPAAENYLLTADGNIIHVTGTLRYRISEPGLRYMFDFSHASNLVQNAFNNSIVFATTRYSIDNILASDAAGYRELVRRRLEQLIDQQKLGVVVDQIDLKTIAPRQLTIEFRAATEAILKSAKTLNEARQYATEKISRAEADKKARLNASQSDRARLVDFVAAEAKRFENLLPAYRLNPDLFLLQQQTETLKRVLANVGDPWILPKDAGGKPPELRLQMNREPPKPKPIAQPASDDHH